MGDFPEYIDGLPNLCGSEQTVAGGDRRRAGAAECSRSRPRWISPASTARSRSPCTCTSR